VLFIIYFKISYTVLIPWSFLFFFSHQKQQKIDFFFEAKMSEYIKIIFFSYKFSFMLTTVGLLFLFITVNNKNMQYIIKLYRKYIYILTISAASIITPPDMTSQLILSSLIIFTFELINYTALVYRKFKVTN